jgi:ferredoxin--NADP+ reductase
VPYSEQRVTSVRQWSDKTFSFTTTRPQEFQFENGEFVTIGLRVDGKLVGRAYSIVSTNDEQHLEFLSIHVPDGLLTSRLVKVREGDGVWVNSKSTGCLTLKYVQPGRNLYLLATGTGLAPFICLIRDAATYQSFARVILMHTVRTVKELAYQQEIEALASERLIYVPSVTREPFAVNQRCSDLFKSGNVCTMNNLPTVDPQLDRVMICGNPEMNRDLTTFLNAQGWTMTSHRGVGNFTVEKAFVLHHE